MLSNRKEASDEPSELSNFELIHQLLFVEATEAVWGGSDSVCPSVFGSDNSE
jgi:hypothetical protein